MWLILNHLLLNREDLARNQDHVNDLGLVLLGSIVIGWLVFFVFYGEKKKHFRLVWLINFFTRHQTKQSRIQSPRAFCSTRLGAFTRWIKSPRTVGTRFQTRSKRLKKWGQLPLLFKRAFFDRGLQLRLFSLKLSTRRSLVMTIPKS